jgi:hypothetical protein
MSEPESERKVAAGEIRRVLLDAAPPKAAHLITWTQAGNQILLDVGYFDLHEIHKQAQPDFAEERVLDWFITDRFILDIDSARRIIESLQQLHSHLASQERQQD